MLPYAVLRPYTYIYIYIYLHIYIYILFTYWYICKFIWMYINLPSRWLSGPRPRSSPSTMVWSSHHASCVLAIRECPSLIKNSLIFIHFDTFSMILELPWPRQAPQRGGGRDHTMVGGGGRGPGRRSHDYTMVGGAGAGPASTIHTYERCGRYGCSGCCGRCARHGRYGLHRRHGLHE